MDSRPLKTRLGARVLMIVDDEVLLLNDSDPGVPGSSWWVTPGGGIDAGEDPAVAACREVEEETGLRLVLADLTGPVARRRACHGYSDRILVQDDVFFTARVDRFGLDTSGWTEAERRRVKAWGWFRLDSLPEDPWPRQIADIAASDASCPLDLGQQEESTIPLTPAEWERVSAELS